MFVWCFYIFVLLVAIGAVDGYRINKRALPAEVAPQKSKSKKHNSQNKPEPKGKSSNAPLASYENKAFSNVDEEIEEIKLGIEKEDAKSVLEKVNDIKKSIENDEYISEAEKAKALDTVQEVENKAEVIKDRIWIGHQLKFADDVIKGINGVLNLGMMDRQIARSKQALIKQALTALRMVKTDILEQPPNEENIKNHVMELTNLNNKLQGIIVAEEEDHQNAGKMLMYKAKQLFEKKNKSNEDVEKANTKIKEAIKELNKYKSQISERDDLKNTITEDTRKKENKAKMEIEGALALQRRIESALEGH